VGVLASGPVAGFAPPRGCPL